MTEEEHYYPFGLTMSGISDRALQFGKYNKYRFQKQEEQSKEFSDGSGLNMYEFKYRFDDEQVGRFWSVDPLASKYPYNSTYAFSEDKVTGDVELEGLEAFPFTLLPEIYDAEGVALGISQSSGNTQELPSLNGTDLKALGNAIEGAAIEDGGFAINQMLYINQTVTSIINLFSKATNNNTSSSNQGSGKGRGSNNRKPDQDAAGSPHSVIDKNGSTTYKPNPQNPSGYDETERIDVKGGAHKDGTEKPIPTPHKHVKGQEDPTGLDPNKDAIPIYLPGSVPLPPPPSPSPPPPPPPVVNPNPIST